MKNTVLWELTPCDEVEIHYILEDITAVLVNFYQTSIYHISHHSLFYH